MIAVVVLTFRRDPAALVHTVRGVLAADGTDLVMVVDNGGSAGAALADIAADRLVVVPTGDNLGYAGGMNVGLRAALARGATAVALLNDDVRVAADWLTPLQRVLTADPSLGAVQPMLVDEGSQPATVNSMGVDVGADGAGVDLHRGAPADADWPEVVPIERFTGGAVLMRAAFVADVGVFDERFFLYYEDVDLGARGARRGWRYACVPASRVWHEGSATTASLGHRQRYYQERNRLWTVASWGSWRQIRTAWWLSIRRVAHPPYATHLRALLAGTVGAPRRLLLRRAVPR